LEKEFFIAQMPFMSPNRQHQCAKNNAHIKKEQQQSDSDRTHLHQPIGVLFKLHGGKKQFHREATAMTKTE